MNRKPSHRPLHAGPLITLLLGAAALGYVFLVFLPVQRSIGRLHRELRGKQDFVAKADQLDSTIEETERRLEQVNSFTAAWQERAPAPTRLSGFYARVIDAAQDAGVKAVRFDPGSPLVLETLRKHPLEMEIEGSFENVFQFTNHLENLDAPLWVEELKIDPRGENSEDLQCEIKMVVFAAHTEDSD